MYYNNIVNVRKFEKMKLVENLYSNYLLYHCYYIAAIFTMGKNKSIRMFKSNDYNKLFCA